MNIVGIVQARMSSTRLPGKVMLEAAGKPMILLMLERVKRCKLLNEIWLATSEKPDDDILAEAVERSGFNVFRGSLDNVLSRFWLIGHQQKADIVVRLTGDCPLHDPEVIDHVINHFLKSKRRIDYASNVSPATYPDGLDTEVFSFEALEIAFHGATAKSDLEHVGPFIRRWAKERDRLTNFLGPANFSHLRWTLDEPEDYLLIKKIYEDLYSYKEDFGWLDILSWQTVDPSRLQVNSKYKRNINAIV